jgi:DNA-binding LacI/PurR family transcriptional regulator
MPTVTIPQGDIVTTIAEQVGVSPRTVQRILTGELRDTRPSIVERAHHIRSLARQMNYRPNAAARATRTGRFNNIAVILATSVHYSTLQEEVLRGMHDVLDESGQHLFVARYSDQQLTDDARVPRILQELNSDGLIINYNAGTPARLRELIDRSNIPSIWLNYKHTHDCIYPDEIAAGRVVTERLLALGHRRIAYFDLSLEPCRRLGHMHFSKEDRLAGYAGCLREAGGVPLVWGGNHDGGPEALIRQITTALCAPDRPTAVVAYGYTDLLMRVAYEVGLHVPRDLSIVTFQGQFASDVPQFRTAGVRTPNIEMGRGAVRMLLQKIESPQRRLPPQVVSGPFLDGFSLACAPTGAGGL